ncbi:hypothetical protein LAZ67_15000548 [Cordylochernes scorpioides]|uniref:Uncharacterized protein n=1 Tax=Cordylochernes scorpioides TaxID=51811 RepID=A0ABY6LBP2_9ARAC|nr:hypothetical protein LAZ67_15000548 [Cordylochernes scorpioides]
MLAPRVIGDSPRDRGFDGGRALGWRGCLEAVAGATSALFFLGMAYRSASLYHPQRSAIQHLKSQRRPLARKSPPTPLCDCSVLRAGAVQILLISAGLGSFGLYTPFLYLVRHLLPL